jgi:hypothetical protein
LRDGGRPAPLHTAPAPSKNNAQILSSLSSVHRIPFNKRMAFLVFAFAWITGVVVLLKFGP